jgi:hypothetical protein
MVSWGKPEQTAFEAKVTRQASYMDFIEQTAKDSPVEAAQMLCVGLMAGVKAELRLGYGIGSALISTLETMERWGHPLSTTEIGVLVERIAEPKPGLVEYGPGHPTQYIDG